ncbi:MAG: pseudouridine synthase [Pseudomonadota bacterium]
MALIPSNRIFHHVTAKPIKLSQVLTDHFKLSLERSRELLELGAIYFNKRRVFEDLQLPQGSYLRLHLQPKRFDVSEINWVGCLLKETKDFIVIDKPAGVPTHATVDNAVENCLTQMRKVLGTNLFVTQRLDTPVGGLLLFAKDKAYQTKFNRFLSERQAQKTYVALVEGPCEIAKYVHWMQPSERSPKVLSLEPKERWLSCELSVLSCHPVLQSGKTLYKVEVELHTGRTHQIRAQLAFLGAPIWGDRLYGSREKGFPSHQIALLAKQLRWPPENQVELPSPYFTDSEHP